MTEYKHPISVTLHNLAEKVKTLEIQNEVLATVQPRLESINRRLAGNCDNLRATMEVLSRKTALSDLTTIITAREKEIESLKSRLNMALDEITQQKSIRDHDTCKIKDLEFTCAVLKKAAIAWEAELSDKGELP